ncbi:627_t:CDS:2, partial [Scutellospora calospora]
RESDLVAKNTRLEEFNKEAELRLMAKFAENQKLVAYYKYLFNHGQKPSNEDFEKLKLIIVNLENETQQKKNKNKSKNGIHQESCHDSSTEVLLNIQPDPELEDPASHIQHQRSELSSIYAENKQLIGNLSSFYEENKQLIGNLEYIK